ncbi:MAG: T9SS type A sorting domain-containing protein [Bacteroidia bacterium]
MRSFISYIFVFAFSTLTFGQSLHIYNLGIDVTNDTVVVPITSNSFNLTNLDIHNTSASTVSFNIDRTITSIDSCDFIYFSMGTICYLPHSESTWASPASPTSIGPGGILPDGLGANGLVAHYDACPTLCHDLFVLYRFYNVAAGSIDTARVTLHYVCLTGIKENAQNNISISAFPNPSSSSVTIDYEVKLRYSRGVIFVYDASGKYIKEIIISDKKGAVRMNVSDFKKGIYFYSIVLDNKIMATQKLIINSE